MAYVTITQERSHAGDEFSQGICPEYAPETYPDFLKIDP